LDELAPPGGNTNYPFLGEKIIKNDKKGGGRREKSSNGKVADRDCERDLLSARYISGKRGWKGGGESWVKDCLMLFGHNLEDKGHTLNKLVQTPH